MQSLLWCFFAWRGYLARQEYALAMLVIVLIGSLIGPLIADMTIGPTNAGEVWLRSDFELAKARAQLAGYMLTAWPTLVVQIKRLRHIGYPPQYLIGANVVLTVVLLIAPVVAMCGFVAGSLYLFLAKGRVTPQQER